MSKLIEERLKEYEAAGHMVPTLDLIKTPEQIEGIRESGKINIAVLDYVAANIRAGMTTEDINTLVHEKTLELGGIPAPLGYEGFPKSVCTSINNQVCHGIPSEEDVLEEGDIINVDVSTIYNGYFADSSRMFIIGETDPEWKRLVDAAKKAIEIGVEHVKPWTFLGDMSQPMNDYVQSMGYSIVEDVGGHGVGLEFHEEPFVCYVAPAGTEMLMVPGMVFTIEPMVNMGTCDVFVDESNDWTIYTDDNMPSAQWEVQVLVTEDGCEILAY